MTNYLTGQELLDAILHPPPPAKPLVTDFLYTDSVCMLTGAAGRGKTVLAVQIAAALSSGTALFGSLDVPTPSAVYYLQLEGNKRETFMRLHYLHQSVPIHGANFHFDFDKRFRVTYPDLVKQKLLLIKERLGDRPLALFIADPIYKLAGDLAKAENAQAVITFSDLITEMFSCSILFIHHPHRVKLDHKGQEIKEANPYYGHSFLYNHVDSSFLMSNPTKDTVELKRDKVREENTRKHLELQFHPESYSLSMTPDPSRNTKGEAVLAFLKECKRAGKTTNFYEIQERCLVSASFLRELQTGHLFSGLVEFRKSPGKRTIWVPK